MITDFDCELLPLGNDHEEEEMEFSGYEEDKRARLLKELTWSKCCSYGKVHGKFMVVQTFQTKKEVTGLRDLHIENNDKIRVRVRVVCKGVTSEFNSSVLLGCNKGKGSSVNKEKGSCPRVLLVSRPSDFDIWTVNKHYCLRTRDVNSCTQIFIANKIASQIEMNPICPTHALQEEFQTKYSVGVSKRKKFRARAIVQHQLHGDYEKQYSILRKLCLGATNNKNWDDSQDTECLGDDLDLPTRANFTFISDQGQGYYQLLQKSSHVLSKGFCLRHIHENMKLKYREKIPPVNWARSHFTGRSHCQMLLNNMCEIFNGKLIDVIDKPIISALEYIREYLMRGVCSIQKAIDKIMDPLTPTAAKLLETFEEEQQQMRYQVTTVWNDQYVVNMSERSCRCRKWELNDIRCKHVVLSTWQEVYKVKVDPINGRDLGRNQHAQQQSPHQLITNRFIYFRMGRPKKKRIRSVDEVRSQVLSQGTKLTRKFITVTCSKCHNRGRNSRSCKCQ
uniref:SWIM-type domain-containing protein n=1 Tax=Lactuca sativa TaxID=4236 RepID=A0A9R1X848_LACSA|nr:hypothetical protein LSAT_V11C500267940 [Lactuca sativa]